MPWDKRRHGMVLGIVCGALLLATLGIPFEIETSRWSATRVRMAWDTFERQPPGPTVFVIGSWVIGAAAIAVAVTLRGRSLGIVQAALGFTGMILMIAGIGGEAVMPRFPGTMAIGFVLIALTLLALIGMVVGEYLGMRFPRRLVGRVMGGACGGVLTILALIFLLSFITFLTAREARRLESGPTVMFAVMVAASALLMAAGVLSAVNIAPLKMGPQPLGRLSVLLAYCGLGVIPVTGLIVATAGGNPEAIPTIINVTILMGVPYFLMGGGGVTLGTALLAAAGPPKPPSYAFAPPAAPVHPAETLKHLKDLLDEGLITEAEYTEKRKQVLDRM